MMIKKIGLALLLTGALAACGTAQTAAGGEHGTEHPSGAPADAGVGHIHGLGVDPATGKTFVAGHYGLFTVEAGKLVRVGDRIADHMGFTVAGPGTFYASGHPSSGDIAKGEAPHLGLIRTVDGGKTWEQVALAGKADFHALMVAGTTVYGYDTQTGQIWRGPDGGKDLKAEARLDLLDLGAGAAAPDTVYATTPEGVKISTDGAKTFTPLKGAPLLSFIDVPDAGRLAGIAPDGQIHLSADTGKTWQTAGRLPMQAVAFTAVNADRFLAATMEGTVYESVDGGENFTVVAKP
ncbi:F510_1955 family glycosylhydrolase [Rhizohabitans arisaemae]|uniref:F510_1955 family glycosylhydrolase n=1 Tax=Rhizohabitans arisaemae TaxID=2720610 RepID=UPI0024B09A93|nr:hypothetical protein [Rhizohabitans arisaemae]